MTRATELKKRLGILAEQGKAAAAVYDIPRSLSYLAKALIILEELAELEPNEEWGNFLKSGQKLQQRGEKSV